MSSTGSKSQDWPLSKEEQKKRIIGLYDKDVKAANELVHSREVALKQAIKELKAARAEAKKLKTQEPEELVDRKNLSKLKAALENGKLGDRRSSWEPEEPASPMCTDDASETTEADRDGAAEAAERLQTVIVDAAATLASLFGTSSLSSVLVGIAEGAEQDGAGTEKPEGRQRAKSEGCRVVAPEPREEHVDRRRRKSRGGTPLRVSWADEVEDDRRRPSIGEPEPSPSNSPKAPPRPAAPAPGQRNCITRRPQRRGRAPAPSSAPSGMLDFI